VKFIEFDFEYAQKASLSVKVIFMELSFIKIIIQVTVDQFERNFTLACCEIRTEQGVDVVNEHG